MMSEVSLYMGEVPLHMSEVPLWKGGRGGHLAARHLRDVDVVWVVSLCG